MPFSSAFSLSAWFTQCCSFIIPLSANVITWFLPPHTPFFLGFEHCQHRRSGHVYPVYTVVKLAWLLYPIYLVLLKIPIPPVTNRLGTSWILNIALFDFGYGSFRPALLLFPESASVSFLLSPIPLSYFAIGFPKKQLHFPQLKLRTT